MTAIESEPHSTPRPRPKRWLLPVLIVVALLGGMTAWFLHITTRRTIVGKTDPATGLHYTFTVAQGWSSTTFPQPTRLPNSNSTLDWFVYDLPQPTPFQTWLYTNIFHK